MKSLTTALFLRFAQGQAQSERAPKGMRSVVLYDGACGVCRGAAAVLRATDRKGALGCRAFQKAEDVAKTYGLSAQDLERELHLVRADGTVLRGFFAVRQACWATPRLWPVAAAFSLPGASWLGPKVYRFLAARRPRTAKRPWSL